jgi:acetyltransferase-like isoleucine patch superfamily enzyme
MIKRKLINWIISRLKNSPEFNEFINTKIHEFHKIETLKIHKVWGSQDRISIGQHVQINDALINTVSGNVEIGDYTFFGHGVSLLTGTHDISKHDIQRQSTVPHEGRDIKIGRGVWISSKAIILGPCVIGDNAVIGAGSLATGYIEANAFYAGTPAKKIKKLSGIDK